MAKTELADLYLIMRDQTVGMRQCLNAAVSASRVEALSMPGEAPTEAVEFLRWTIDFVGQGGEQFSPQFRRESAAALAYYERRAKKAELQYQIPDTDERRTSWRRILNGALRLSLARANAWPQRKDILLSDSDQFEMPPDDPDSALTALLLPATSRRKERRQRAIDDPGGPPVIASEQERQELIKLITKTIHHRLEACGMAHLEAATGTH